MAHLLLIVVTVYTFYVENLLGLFSINKVKNKA